MGSAIEKLSEKVIELKYGSNENIFWDEFYTNKGTKDYKINTVKLRGYLHEKGFRNYNGEPILIANNIATKVNPEFIFTDTLEYIESFKNAYLEAAFLKHGESLLIKTKSIILGLKESETEVLRDAVNTSYHYYKNGVVMVSKMKPIELIPYEEIKGFIWESSILQREFKMFVDSDEVINQSMFFKFLTRVTNDEEHLESLLSAIGYLLHKYKDQRKPIAIIINDENLVDEGKPKGGTGKGIIVKALSSIIEKAMYNGKNSDFTNNKFAYQNVKDTTNVLVIDDAPRGFDFEGLFSVLTDDMPIERKHKPMVVFPYSDSPKFVITTNYTIKGTTSSFKRRRFDTYLTNYYSDTRTPAEEFKCEFFNGWDKEQWQEFDYFMMTCLRKFLSFGLIPFESYDLRLKMLKNETSAEFYELMEESFNKKRIIYTYSEIRQKLISIFGEKYYFLEKSHKIVVDWVDRYAEFKKLKVDKRRGNNGYRFEFL
ncbi:DUF5906 domain-containing protein [Seonamhaeicola sp. MEBiC1930]|uniref:DUF5906 domain-containing protein n=1 Tax=Seonamhaeicola sp. MEBiC01930 TaxID=2976768 RepID=UPI003248D146